MRDRRLVALADGVVLVDARWDRSRLRENGDRRMEGETVKRNWLSCLALFWIFSTAPGQETLTNESIIKLTKGGLGESVIVGMITSQPGNYSVDAERIAELKAAGASDGIVSAMRSKTQGTPPEGEEPEGVEDGPESESGEINKQVKQLYDGKTLVLVASGLMAGEYQKQMLGPGQIGMVVHHFHDSISLNPLPKKLAKLNQLDSRTFVELKGGLNVTKLEKGEQVRVNKFYMRGNYVDLFIEPLDPSHLHDLDFSKASKSTRTTYSGNAASSRTRVAGFGLRCRFYFDQENVLRAGNLKAITDEIHKYLLPAAEAAKLKGQEDNVEIDLEMTEEEIVKRLGAPLKTIKIGSGKILKFKDVTITLKDGKVSDIKVE